MTTKGQNSNFTKYKEQDAYKHLEIIKDDIYTKLDQVFKNNRWNLKNGFEELQEHLENINKPTAISWLNDIQYLDYKPNKLPKVNKVSLEAFQKGEYKNKYTLDKTDNKVETEKRYANRLVFFNKNFNSFKQFENNDDLSWVVYHNRLLIYEIMNYHNNKGNTIATLLKDIKSILRATLLLLGETSELRYKISNLSTDLKLLEQFKEDTNKIQTSRELLTFVPYENLIDIVDELEEQYNKELNKLPKDIRKNGLKHSKELFNLHQNILALALYIWDYPSRYEKWDMQFITNDNEVKDEGNYINIAHKNCKLIFNSEVKKHKPITYTLTSTAIKGLNNRLCKLLKYSYKTYPRPNLFISRTGWNSSLDKVNPSVVAEWVRELIPNKNIGVNGMRSAFISYYYNKFNNQQKQILITRMRTSKTEVERNYLKQYTDIDTIAKVKIEPNENIISKVSIASDAETAWVIDDNNDNNVVIPKQITNKIQQIKPVENIQNKKRENFKEWYAKPINKELHKSKMRDRNNSPEVVAKRYIRELNAGKLDFNRIQQATKDKFKLHIKNGKYYSELVK